MDPQLLVPLTQAVQQLGDTNRYLAHLVQLNTYLVLGGFLIMGLYLVLISRDTREVLRMVRDLARR